MNPPSIDFSLSLSESQDLDYDSLHFIINHLEQKQQQRKQLLLNSIRSFNLKQYLSIIAYFPEKMPFNLFNVLKVKSYSYTQEEIDFLHLLLEHPAFLQLKEEEKQTIYEDIIINSLKFIEHFHQVRSLSFVTDEQLKQLLLLYTERSIHPFHSLQADVVDYCLKHNLMTLTIKPIHNVVQYNSIDILKVLYEGGYLTQLMNENSIDFMMLKQIALNRPYPADTLAYLCSIHHEKFPLNELLDHQINANLFHSQSSLAYFITIVEHAILDERFIQHCCPHQFSLKDELFLNKFTYLTNYILEHGHIVLLETLTTSLHSLDPSDCSIELLKIFNDLKLHYELKETLTTHSIQSSRKI